MPQHKTFDHATCPFCALACDDLSIKSDGSRLSVSEDLPKFCRASYEKASEISITTPRYKGKEITLTEAVAKACEMLKQADAPLFSGLITDIQGMRALLPLARQCNAALDHIDSGITLRNLTVMQGCGGVATTLSEIRGRADLIIFIGEHIFDNYPRLLQRIYSQKSSDIKSETKSILVGPWQPESIPKIIKKHCDIINTPTDKFPEFIQNLSMQIHQRLYNRYTHIEHDNKDDNTLYTTLADDIEHAEYPVFIWSSKDMNYAHADLNIFLLSQLIKKLNSKKRCVGLALSGNRGAGNVQSVCLWQSGYPGYLSFNSARPYYNPLHNRTAELLNCGRTDLLMWIASIHPEPPPESDLPTIALVHPMIAEKTNCDLVIPIGIPGIDHTGFSYRTDGVVILPLPKLRDRALPALHEILRDIQQQLNG